MPDRAKTIVADLKWFNWVALVGFGVVAGLLIIVIINTRPRASGDAEEKKMAESVARHVLLPTAETPALATVTDPAKLKNNKFLSQAQKGDKILIYARWKQAVIYRPSADRVVDIGPVDVAPPGGDTSGFNPLK